MGSAALDLDFPVLLPNRAYDQIGGELPINIDAHNCSAEIGRVQLAGSVKPALLTNREKQRDRRMWQLVLDERFSKHDRKRDAGACVAPKRGRAV
jgi:hypothetical protein